MLRTPSSKSVDHDSHLPESHPLVSAIIPARNSESTIGRAIDSTLKQTYSRLEIIVVDDGSDDKTASIARSYGEQVRVIRQEHGGAASARNTAIKASTGPLIANLDSDDYWATEKIERQVSVMLENPRIGALSTRRIRLRNGKNHSRSSRSTGTLRQVSFAEQLFRSRVCSPSMMIRRSCLDSFGGYDETIPVMEDYDLWLRLLSKGVRVATLHEPLYYFYEHDHSVRSCCDRVHDGLTKLIKKWERHRHESPSCPESTFENAFCWWLFKAAVQYRRKGRHDLSRVALTQAAARRSGWRLQTLVRASEKIPPLLSIANQVRPWMRSTG